MRVKSGLENQSKVNLQLSFVAPLVTAVSAATSGYMRVVSQGRALALVAVSDGLRAARKTVSTHGSVGGRVWAPDAKSRF